MSHGGRITRVGLVGAGRIAQVHAHAIRAAGAEIAAVVASTPQRAAEAAERMQIPNGLASLSEMLAEDSVQAVHVTSPNNVHHAHVAEVIAAGRHFVCEKPFVTRASRADALSRAAREAGVVGTVAFTYRYHPVARAARARVARGDLGPLITVQGGYVQDWMLTAPRSEWRLDPAANGASRAFADIGSHAIDLLEFIAGERVARLTAVETTAVGDPTDTADDAVALLVQLGGGAIGSLLVSQVTAGHGQGLTLELSGERAGIKLDQEDSTRLWRGTAGAGRGEHDDLTARDQDDVSSAWAFAPNGTMDDYFRAFSEFVRESYEAMATMREPDGLPTVAAGARAVRVGEAVRRATRTREWVDVP